MVDAKLADHIVIWAQTTLRNTIRENLDAPAKHFQYYCELLKSFILILITHLKTYMSASLEHLWITWVVHDDLPVDSPKFVFSVVDSYDWLVNGKAQNLVKKFLEEDHSFDQYTEVNMTI